MIRDGLKFYKPTTSSGPLVWRRAAAGACPDPGVPTLAPAAGMRHRVTTSREGLWKGKPFKALTQGMAKTGGRNNHGHICAWHRGGGHRCGPPVQAGSPAAPGSPVQGMLLVRWRG